MLKTEVKATDTDNKTALIPLTDETAEKNDPDDHVSSENTGEDHDRASVQQSRVPMSALRGIFVSFFSAVSVTVFGICTFSAFSAADFDIYFPVRLMLGEFFGGYKNIEAVPSDDRIADYVSPILDEISAEKSTDPVSPIPEDIREEPDNADSVPRITLASDPLGLVNETPYEPDTAELLGYSRVIPTADEIYSEYGDDAPIVLIIHTHGTEAYSDNADSNYRSTDTAKNIVACGTAIADILESRGIHTIHCKTMFDEKDYTLSYYSASLEIKRIIKEYPSVSYIIDVHRDSVMTGSTYSAPSVEYVGGYTAQMMFVIGTDHGGAEHPNWRNNLALALRLQDSLNKEAPQIMRTANLRSASFNEQYSQGSLLLEIGACATSLSEAVRSAELFADALADEITGN